MLKNPKTTRAPKKKQKTSDDPPIKNPEEPESTNDSKSQMASDTQPNTTVPDWKPPPQMDANIPQPLSKMKFEDMFYNRTTQKCAFDLFLTSKLESMNRGFSSSTRPRHHSPGDLMRLRSSDPPPLVKPNLAGEDRSSPKAGSSGGVNAVEMPNGPIDQEKLEKEAGDAMVNEILNRYESSKFKDCQTGGKGKSNKTDPMDDDDFEFDYNELAWVDEIDLNSSRSDFMKHSVPQWELKEQLRKMHFATIENMTPSQVEVACKEQIPELMKIMNEEVPSNRHEIFKTTGLNKHQLRDMTVAEPFTSAQDYRVMNVITDKLFTTRDEEAVNGELMHYVSTVLFPEALIRIFATANGIPLDLAEKELRYGAGYDGVLPESIIRTITSDKQVNKENIL